MELYVEWLPKLVAIENGRIAHMENIVRMDGATDDTAAMVWFVEAVLGGTNLANTRRHREQFAPLLHGLPELLPLPSATRDPKQEL